MLGDMFKSLMLRTNNLKLKHKLLYSYIFVVMIPVLIVGGAVTGYFRQQAMDRAIEQSTNNVERVKSSMKSMLRVPTDVSDFFMLDKKLEDIATTHYASVLELTKAYINYDDFEEYVRQYREISEIRFYYDNPTLINNLEFIPVDEKIEEAGWYRQAMSNRSIGWFYIEEEGDFPIRRLCLVRQIKFSGSLKSGVLMVVLKQEELNRLLRNEPFDTLISDENGYVVAAKNPALVGLTLDELDYGIDLHMQDKGTLKANIQREPSYVAVDSLIPDSSMNGLKFVSVFTTESIVKDANRVAVIGLIIVLTILLLALAFVYIVSLLTTNRMLRVTQQLNRLAMGDLNVVSPIDGNDEIGQLSRQFNYMVQSINRLMEQVVEKTEQNNALEIAQREIKLKMLASQINPHFLFNALESIRMHAYMNGEKEIANIVRLLGKLMRKNLEVGREHIPLRDELDVVQTYLEIQKFRFEERLKYNLSIDAEAAGLRVPPLIIQPLVENAVIHGMEDLEKGVRVEVTVVSKSDNVLVTVRDNGAGMTPSRLQEVIQRTIDPDEPEENRIGLRNVHQRLVMLYGAQHGLNISSQEGKGTEISFTLPTI